MKRLICCLLLVAASGLAASGAHAQDEGEIEAIQDRAAMFQVLSVLYDEEQGYIYEFEDAQSFGDQDASARPPVLFSSGGALVVRTVGIPKVLVFVESDDGYPGLIPNALMLTEDDSVGSMETMPRDGAYGGPFVSGHLVRVLVCPGESGQDRCDRWIEAIPRGVAPDTIFFGSDLLIISGPELGGGRVRPDDD